MRAEALGPTAAPPAVTQLFGDRAGLVRAYAQILVTAGVDRGLLGPREADRVWERHILNCAVVGELIRPGERVVDVGSGAGLPGVVLALLRPDLSVQLVDSLERRTNFLSEVIADLRLPNVTVCRGRAEDRSVRQSVGGADVVAARAVAGLDRLGSWCLPLARPGGRLLAIKGATAGEEVRKHRPALRRAGGDEIAVIRCGVDVVTPATTVVQVVRTS